MVNKQDPVVSLKWLCGRCTQLLENPKRDNILESHTRHCPLKKNTDLIREIINSFPNINGADTNGAGQTLFDEIEALVSGELIDSRLEIAKEKLLSSKE